MHDSGRRVQKLRITSNDEAVIKSQVNALEDAFRTASFPGLPPHGLVLVRYLDLGHFNTTASSMMLSQLIDKKIQNIAGLAVCVDEEEHPEASVVWFSDTVQPLLSLLILLLENKKPRAWYWKSQIPTWHAAMDFSQSLSCVMQKTVDGTSRRSGGNEIIQLLMNYGKVEEIFSVLTTQLAIQLFTESSHFPQILRENIPVAHSKIDIRQNVDVKWIKLIMQAVDHWGENDPRTLWLTYSTLVKHNPCLERSNEIMPMIPRLISQCTRNKATKTKTEIEAHGTGPFTNESLVERPHQKGVEGGYVSKKPDFADTNSSLIDININPLRHRQNEFSQSGNQQINDLKQELIFSTETSKVIKKSMKVDVDLAEPVYKKDNESAWHDINQYAAYGFIFSAYSGLSFIIPLLEYIGIQEMLKLNPWLAELNFPGRIIRAVTSRLEINRHDPIFKIVAELPDCPDLERIQFISPAIWESLIYWSDDKNKIAYRFLIAGEGQTCYITDKSKRFLLYLGDTDKTAIPKWLGNIRIIDKAGVFVPLGLADLEISTQLLFGKFLRRYARTSLKQLMHREGLVAITKTHLDILFDPRLAESHIRIAGLDINPGWVSWLGKVVQFHYDYDGYVHV